MAEEILRHVAVETAEQALKREVLDNFLDVIQHQFFCQQWILTAFDVMVMGKKMLPKEKVGNLDVANFTRGVLLVWARDLVHQLHFSRFQSILKF